MGKKLAFLVLGVIVLTLLLAPVAMATSYSPQDIYNDFATNGKLTHSYTQAQLKAYLNDTTLGAYSLKTIKSQLDNVVEALVRPSFPFTGFQMLLAGIAVVALVGGGLALRRFSRQA